MGRVREEKRRRKKIQVREKVGKSRNIVFFPMICGSGGSRSRLAKAAGAELSGQMKDEKLHAVVARSTCQSQNVQNTPCSDHFWKLRCRKSARRCGAKHMSKSKITKHTILEPFLEVEMSKKCTLLRREAHVKVKMYKHTRGSDHFWKLRCRKSARRCGTKHISKSKCTKHIMFGPLLKVQMWFCVAGTRDSAPCQKGFCTLQGGSKVGSNFSLSDEQTQQVLSFLIREPWQSVNPGQRIHYNGKAVTFLGWGRNKKSLIIHCQPEGVFAVSVAWMH